jgi:hypothetical protein
MSFKADPGAIRMLGSGVTDLAGDAEQARTYANQWLGIGFSEGRLFIQVVQQATAVREALQDNYEHLASLMVAAGAELRRAADHYEQTDLQEQARLDTTYGRG